ncbi:hypothetical protein GCM10009557_67850 [Virgisporangium ochraceum]
MDRARRVHGAAGGHERLGGHLAAEHPQPTGRWVRALKRHLLDLLQVEEIDESVYRAGGHPSTSDPSWCIRSVLVAPGELAGVPATTTT